MQKKNKRLRSRHLFFLHVLTRKPICEANQEAAEQRAFECMGEQTKRCMRSKSNSCVADKEGGCAADKEQVKEWQIQNITETTNYRATL